MVTKRRMQVEPVSHLRQAYIKHFSEGLVATDGVVYSTAVTLATANTSIFTQLVDPIFGMNLDEVQVSLTQRFSVIGVITGSLRYYWQVRSEGDVIGTMGRPIPTTLAYVNVTGTYTKGVGTAAASEDTFSGYLSLTSMPRAPLRFTLTAAGLDNSILTGQVKNSSYVKMVGTVIPGT